MSTAQKQFSLKHRASKNKFPPVVFADSAKADPATDMNSTWCDYSRLIRLWQRTKALALVPFVIVSLSANALEITSAFHSSLAAQAGGGGDSMAAIISADGRYVLFASTADNLAVASNGSSFTALFPPKINVFLRDRSNETTTLASFNLSGTAGGNGDSTATGLSTNAQLILFESRASDLIQTDTNNITDVFVRDRIGNTNLLITVSTNGGNANGESRGSVTTPDGRYVAFVSAANNLVANDTNQIPDVFVRDLQAGVTTLVSTNAMSTNINSKVGGSESPDITPDGRYVAFYSTATNLVLGVKTIGEIYVRDLVAGTTYLASTNARTVVQAVMGAANAAKTVSYNHAISADGQFIAYETSPAALSTGIILRHNLATGFTDIVHTNANVASSFYEDIRSLDMTPDGRFIAFVANTNGTSGATTCVLLWDAQTGTNILVSGDTNGAVATNSTCGSPSIDASGRWVTFLGSATNLTTNVVVGDYHLYVRDTQSNVTELINVDTNGVGWSVGAGAVPRMSAGGRFVAFESLDENLVANDRNRDFDVFVRDLAADATELVSARHSALPSRTANGPSTQGSLSADGRYVAFASDAGDLAPMDTNTLRDVFVRDVATGSNFLVSVGTNGFSGNGVSTEPVISADGRYVAFTSYANNLVAGDANNMQDVFVRDMQNGTAVLVSVNTAGNGSGNNLSYSPAISADGKYVLFRSKASNLSAGSFAAGSENVFVRNRVAPTNYPLTLGGVTAAAMTADGRFVAFIGKISSSATTALYVWDSQSTTRVYTNTTVGISFVAISPDGNRLAYGTNSQFYVADRMLNTNWAVGPGPSGSHQGLRFSGDGRFFVYSMAVNNTNHVYLYDLQTGDNLLVSHSFSSIAVTGNGAADWPDISPDGRFVAYRSAASNIVLSDTNAAPDIFFYDRLTGTNMLVTANRFGNAAANNHSLAPAFSGDGRSLGFQSWASDLEVRDFNQTSDVFAFNLLYVSISRATPPAQGIWLDWPTAPWKSYGVQYKNTFTDPNWQDFNGSITNIGNRDYLNDPSPAALLKLYRVVEF